MDVEMPARYGRETSKIKYGSYIGKVSWLLFRDFFYRLRMKYIVLSFHPLVIFYLFGLGADACGTGCRGVYRVFCPGRSRAPFHPGRALAPDLRARDAVFVLCADVRYPGEPGDLACGLGTDLIILPCRNPTRTPLRQPGTRWVMRVIRP